MSASAASSLALPDPIPSHPRLMASEKDFVRLRAQLESDEVTRKIFHRLKKRADVLLKEPPVERIKTGRRLLHVSRKALSRISVLAMAARLTGNSTYSRRAISEALAACAFSDWNPEHFLDTAEMSLGVAIAYDWLHDDLSGEERNTIAEALVEKGIKPSYVHHFWVVNRNNWNQVCHAGTAAAAVAVADRNPQLAEDILRRAAENIHHAAEAYAPDGAYPEGPMYWSYGTTFHVILADIFKRFYGDTRGVDQFPGFDKSAEYITQVTAPSGTYFNYSDSRAGRGLALPLFWMARKYQHPEWLRFDAARLSEYLDRYDEDLLGEHYRVLALVLLWWEPLAASAPPPPLSWHATGNASIAVFRSSHDDPNALYAAMKGGGPSLSHAHMDAGAFVLEADGVRWASDLGMQEYESLERLNVNLWNAEPGGRRWTIFRLGPDSHNILRFNSAPQSVPGMAVPIGYRAGSNPACTYDLSSLYPEVRSAFRGMSLLNGKAVLFQDEWSAGAEPVEVTWQMLTTAGIRIEGNRIHLTQADKSFCLEVLEPSDAKIEFKDVSAPREFYDAENPGAKMLLISTRTAENTNGRFCILGTPGSCRNAAAPEIKALSAWF